MSDQIFKLVISYLRLRCNRKYKIANSNQFSFNVEVKNNIATCRRQIIFFSN